MFLPGLGTDPQAEMYLPYRQADLILPVFQLSMVMRTAGDPVLQTSALRSALAEIDPNQPLVKVRTMEENMATTVAQPRFRAWLIGIFAMLALVLAAVGVYGVMSYTVTQRTSEIGVRVTMGAQPQDVFRIIVGEGVAACAVWRGSRPRCRPCSDTPAAKFSLRHQRLRSAYVYGGFGPPDAGRGRGVLFPGAPRHPRRSHWSPCATNSIRREPFRGPQNKAGSNTKLVGRVMPAAVSEGCGDRRRCRSARRSSGYLVCRFGANWR